MNLGADQIQSLQRGMEHFRAGDYFAAHDDWEEVWQGLRGSRRTFWQAMIQLAVGAYHLKNGNRKGCESLWSKALVKCEELQNYTANTPAPLSQLTDLLYTCLAALHQGEEPWPHLTCFAHSELSEAWFALPY